MSAVVSDVETRAADAGTPLTEAQARMFLDHGRIALSKPELAKTEPAKAVKA